MRGVIAFVALAAAAAVDAATFAADGPLRLLWRAAVVALVGSGVLLACALDRGRFPRPDPIQRTLALAFLLASVLISHAVVPFAETMVGGVLGHGGGALLELVPLAAGLFVWGRGATWQLQGILGRVLAICAVLILPYAAVEHGLLMNAHDAGPVWLFSHSLTGWLALAAAVLMACRGGLPRDR